VSDQQPNPNIPAWAQQPGPAPAPGGWGAAPQPPAPKNHRTRNIVLGVVGVVVVIGIIGAATGGGGKKNDDKAAASPVATTQQATTPAQRTTTEAAAPTTTRPKPKPVAKTVLTESGNGIKTTAKFHVGGDWDLHYTYDCSNFGLKGNFIVTTGGTDFPLPLANELGMKGSEVTHQHDGGTLYLDINSECSWTVKVVDIP
jgi:hypothetical protein